MILLTGGTGFVGSHLARRLAVSGEKVRCLLRQASPRFERIKGLDVEIANGDVTDAPSLPPALEGVETVIHLVAIIREVGGATFESVNYGGTKNLLEACRRAGVRRFIYMSNIGAGPDARFSFLYSKWKAEEEVRRSGLNYTVFRSSIIFGEGDEFINRLAGIVRKSPVAPVVGSGRSLFQPIWVEDAVTCFLKALQDSSTIGQAIPIGGPEHLSIKEIIRLIVQTLGVRRLLVPMPIFIMYPVAFLGEALLPNPPVTRGQLTQLALDNITYLDAVERVFSFQPARLADRLDYIKRR